MLDLQRTSERRSSAGRSIWSAGPLVRGRLLRLARDACAADHDASHRVGWLVDRRAVAGAERAVRAFSAGSGPAAAAAAAVRRLHAVAARTAGRGRSHASAGVLA